MLVEFFVWWYGTGWMEASRRIGLRVRAIWRIFSVPILLKTLFAPWRRIISPPGKTIDEIIRGIVDNLVSRTVGFVVRVFVLFAAAVLLTFSLIIGGVCVIAWPLLPLAAVFCLVKGILP